MEGAIVVDATDMDYKMERASRVHDSQGYRQNGQQAHGTGRRTAPKAVGQDYIETILLTDEQRSRSETR